MPADRSPTPFRQRHTGRTRDRILDTSLRLFSNRGYDGASMKDIALELEATKGLLYHYFRSKQEILAAIIQEHPLRTEIEFFEANRGGKTLEQALSSAALLSLRSMVRYRDFVLFLLIQAQSAREQADVVFDELTDRWTAMFQSVIDQRVPRPESSAAPLLAQQLVDILLASFIRNELSSHATPHLEAYVLDAVHTVIIRLGPARRQISRTTQRAGT